MGACTKDSDCLQGLTCFLHSCKADNNDDKKPVSLQLIPPSSYTFKDRKASISKQQFVGIIPAKIHQKTIQARVAFNIQGEIYSRDKEGKSTPVPAKIRFIDQESIPGHPLSWEITTDPRQTSTGRYQHRLSYGTYQVEVWPRNNNRPPHRVQFIVQGHQQIVVAGKKTQDIELPAEKDYLHVTGRLLSSSSPGAVMGGLKVQLISGEGLPISRVFTTSNKQGTFDIWLAKDTKPDFLRIQQKNTLPFHPQLDIPYRPPPVTKDKDGRKIIDLGDMAVGLTSKNIRVYGKVRARLQDGGYPSPNTQIRIIGEIDTGTYKEKILKGSYIVNVRSDSSGYYNAEFPPGKYHFEVIPPADSDRSRAYIVPSQSYFHANREIDLELSPKRRIVGKVCQESKDGNCLKKLPHAQIQALWRRPLPQAQKRLSIAQTPSFRTEISQNDGSYELTLDPGFYDFIYVPTNESGLARLIRTNVEINNSDAKPYVQLDGLLPKAKHLVGQILDNSRFPIANTTIEMYSYSNTKQTARLLGRAVTNSQGFFSIPYHAQ